MAEKLYLESLRNKSSEALVLEANIPDFPVTKVIEHEYPIIINALRFDKTSLTLCFFEDFTFEIGDNNEAYQFLSIYELLYGITTQKGKDLAFQFESSMHGALKWSRKDSGEPLSQLLAHHLGFNFEASFKNVHIQWLPDLDIVRYLQLSEAGNTIAIRDYFKDSDRVRWDTRGVFRINDLVFNSDKDFLVIVDTPEVEAYLIDQGIPALSLPCLDEIECYDYAEIIRGKTVFFCLKEYGYNFSYSFYPFASYLLVHEIEIYLVDYSNAFEQQFLPNFLHSKDISDLKKLLQNFSYPLHPSDIPPAEVFDDQLQAGVTKQFQPSQDYVKQSMVYAIDKGKVFFSNPTRIFPLELVEVMEGLEPSNSSEIVANFSSLMMEKIERHDFLPPLTFYYELRKFLKSFIHFNVDEYFTILTLWIMGTYFFRMFKAFPYIHLQGERGTGKTSVMELVSKVAFQGFFLTKATISTLTEQAHVYGSTLCIDEFEDYSSTRKSHDELSKFLNGGYNHLGSYTKKYQGKSNTYSTYTPKIFGGTGNINIETLQSRTIPFKTFKKPENITKQQFMEFDPIAMVKLKQFTTSGYAMGIVHSKKLYELSLTPIEESELPDSKKQLNNRQAELARPLITIAHFLKDETITSSLLTGLDRCWNTITNVQNKEDEQLLGILQNFVSITDPLKAKENKFSDYLVFETKYLLEYQPVLEFYNPDNVPKKKFNRRIKALAGVLRENIKIEDFSGVKSCYLFPKNKFS